MSIDDYISLPRSSKIIFFTISESSNEITRWFLHLLLKGTYTHLGGWDKPLYLLLEVWYEFSLFVVGKI